MTRLYPAYARDVLSFLDFAQLQECRLVSHSMNATVDAHPVSISARRPIYLLNLLVGSVEDFGSPPIDEDGYADTSETRGDGEGKPWKAVQAEWDCCREELVYSALALAGERILPSHPATTMVQIWIKVGEWGIPRGITALCVRNEMTTETAFGVLHLLHHLRRVYAIKQYLRMLDSADGDCGMAMNPLIFGLLSSSSRAAYKLHVQMHSVAGTPLAVPTLAANIGHLKLRELWWQIPHLGVAFDFALQARRHCKVIRLGNVEARLFDPAIEHFRSALPRLGRDVVSELILQRYYVDDFWPSALPPKEEMEALGCDEEWGGDLYRLRGGMTNVNSGEHFGVEVLCRWGDSNEEGQQQEYLSEVRILFGR